MNLLFVADGRSPTTKGWITNMQKDGHQISLITTYACKEFQGLAGFYTLPVAFSRYTSSNGSVNTSQVKYNLTRWLIRTMRPYLLRMRYTLGPLTLPYYQKQFVKIVGLIRPEIIHALRIPFEGMLAQSAPDKYPLILSVWGNDLTLHAMGSYSMEKATQAVLSRANGLISDTGRDIRLAKNWGFNYQLPHLVVPGCGGINLEKIENARLMTHQILSELIPPGRRLVVNPRGLRPGSLRTDIFFEAIRIVSAIHPEVCFICPSMAEQPEATQIVARSRLDNNVILLPRLTQDDLWWLFTRAEITVSPGEHDGVPNSLLESMACGCYPIVGDIESIREWITPGVNGLLYPPGDASALAESILLILDNPERRLEVAKRNLNLIRERADQTAIRKSVSAFYKQVAES